MSAFTDGEIEYLRSQGTARLATVGPDGQPHDEFRHNARDVGRG